MTAREPRRMSRRFGVAPEGDSLSDNSCSSVADMDTDKECYYLRKLPKLWEKREREKREKIVGKKPAGRVEKEPTDKQDFMLTDFTKVC